MFAKYLKQLEAAVWRYLAIKVYSPNFEIIVESIDKILKIIYNHSRWKIM